LEKENASLKARSANLFAVAGARLCGALKANTTAEEDQMKSHPHLLPEAEEL
jgi:hypothetical protein